MRQNLITSFFKTNTPTWEEEVLSSLGNVFGQDIALHIFNFLDHNSVSYDLKNSVKHLHEPCYKATDLCIIVPQLNDGYDKFSGTFAIRFSLCVDTDIKIQFVFVRYSKHDEFQLECVRVKIQRSLFQFSKMLNWARGWCIGS